jgi:hypothetical protein
MQTGSSTVTGKNEGSVPETEEGRLQPCPDLGQHKRQGSSTVQGSTKIRGLSELNGYTCPSASVFKVVKTTYNVATKIDSFIKRNSTATFFFGGTGVRSQGFALATQVLYQLSQAFSPFSLWATILLVTLPTITGMTDSRHGTQLLIEMRVS